MADRLWEGLVDFSFQKRICAQLVKVLYFIAVLAGGIAVIVFVVAGMQQSAAQGLLALLGGVVIWFVSVLYVRMALEVVLAILRIAENTGA